MSRNIYHDPADDVFAIMAVVTIVALLVFLVLAFAGVFNVHRYAGDTKAEAVEISTAAIVNQCSSEVIRHTFIKSAEPNRYAGHAAWRISYYTGKIKTFVWYSNYTKKDYSVVLGC